MTKQGIVHGEKLRMWMFSYTIIDWIIMYLTAFRPDIMFDVCAWARFQVTPKVSHLNAVKRIFRYLKGQPKLGLWYPRYSPFDLKAFFDSDYAGSSLDKKSTTGGCQFLGKRLISWQCKKQSIVANSITEAGYVTATNFYGQTYVPRSHRGIIAQTRSKRASKHSYDSPLPGGNTPGSDEERLIIKKRLTVFVPPTSYDSPLSGGHIPGSDEGMKLFKISTSKRKILDKEYVSKQGRKSGKTKPMFDDSDFAELDVDNAMENVKGDAETQGRNTAEQITTTGDIVNTVSIDVYTDQEQPSVVIRNVEEEPRRATPVPTVQSQDECKGKMVEPEPTPKNPIKNQIQRDAEIAQRFFEEEQAQFKREQRIVRERVAEQEVKDAAVVLQEFEDLDLVEGQLRKEKEENKSFEEIQKLYKKEHKWIKDFIPMDSAEGGKNAASSKKRPRAELDEESFQMEEVYVEALHVKYPIIDWEVYSEDTRRYWRIIRDLVKKRFSTTEPTDDKEKELWVELKRLFKPDNDDIL
ncbi:hypothetical protein Tco_0857731 [Tanacetum coccineum]|uniref:Uncharacterized protein n=1 Tax=Tanacetum coccineum TaxID=301880 RepID=A0ABQ5BCS1_9ASTR